MINYSENNGTKTHDNYSECEECTRKLSHRGPDGIKSEAVHYINNQHPYNLFMGFTRLAINDLTDEGMQPFSMSTSQGAKYVVCNGEIYNHEFLNELFGRMSESDCGVLLNLFDKLPFNIALRYLDAEFALVYFDGNTVYAARDRYGVRPLFIGTINDEQNPSKSICISSEMKAIPSRFNNVFQLNPTTFMSYKNGDISFHEYYIRLTLDSVTPNTKNMRKILESAVRKRLMSDRPLGFLLSGGLDSSLIVYIASKMMDPDQMICFTIGTEDSPDIKAAKELTTFLNIKNHHILKFDIEEGIREIPNVIRTIESYDITTIRASVPQYLLGRYIKENTDVRVILSGEGSDEIHGSYKYFEKAPSKEAFREECARLLSELCYFDNLRTDRTMAAWGLEVRCPFLDHQYVNYIFTSDADKYMFYGIEKGLLRSAFNNDIPYNLLYRKKDAFSDSVSSDKENWRQSIISKVSNEQQYYEQLFDEIYPNRLTVIPHLWMPKWYENITDPSATILV